MRYSSCATVLAGISETNTCIPAADFYFLLLTVSHEKFSTNFEYHDVLKPERISAPVLPSVSYSGSQNFPS